MKKVLIIEDDLSTVEVVAFKLNQKGIPATIALNGKEALDRLEKGKYDLLLVDLLLPEKSGFEIIKEVRTNSSSKNAKIIVFSNLGQKEDIEKAMNLGADDYIIKVNIGIEELVERIEQEIEK